MEEKVFLAESFQEAVEKVKREFGSDGIVLNSREVKKGFSAFGLFGKTMVEITARPGKSKTSASSQNLNSPDPADNPYGSENAHEDRRRLLAPVNQQLSEMREMIAEVARDKLDTDNKQALLKTIPYELAELKSMFKNFVSGEPLEGIHTNLASLYQTLIFNGVEAKFAKKLIREVQKQLPKEKYEDFDYVRLYVARIFMQVISIVDFPKDSYGRFCFVGPTGVGKTTTIAKIASLLRQENPQRKISLVTTDTFRIGAKEQLKEYADRIKVNFKYAEDSSKLRLILGDLPKNSTVLIDTPGASQRDEIKLKHLKDMLLSQDNICYYLVFGANQKDDVTDEITKRYGTFPINSIIITKLDEAATYGGIFNHSIRYKIPIMGLTTGQNVPDDFQFATRERLIDLLLNISGTLNQKNKNPP